MSQIAGSRRLSPVVTGQRYMPTFANGLPQTSLLYHAGAPDHVVAAGAMHDLIEKTDVRAADLRERFGHRITDLVCAVSDDERIAGYASRKAALRQKVAGAGEEALNVFAADKLSKLRELRRKTAAYARADASPDRIREDGRLFAPTLGATTRRTDDLCLDLRGEPLPGCVEEFGQDRVELEGQVVLLEGPVVVERFMGCGQVQLSVGHARAGRAERLAQIRLGPQGPERACAGADHCDGLIAQNSVVDRPRGPVDRVLQLPRDR